MDALRPIVAVAALIAAVPASAMGDFMLINGTGQALSEVSVRPVGGDSWRQLGSGNAGSGSRQAVSIASGEQCAFDIRASLASGAKVTWPDVNLCQTKAVTLNRRPDGTTWVDYE